MRALLAASEVAGDALDAVASPLARLLEESGTPVREDELGRALRVAVLGKNATMIAQIMPRRALGDTGPLRQQVLALASHLMSYSKRLGELAALEVQSDGARLASLLAALPAEDTTSVMRAAVPEIAASFNSADEAADVSEEVENGRMEALAESVAALATGLAGQERQEAAEQMLLALLDVDSVMGQELADTLELQLAPIRSPDVIEALVREIPTWAPARWSSKLQRLDQEATRAAVDSEVLLLWARTWWEKWLTESAEEMPEFLAALEAAETLRALNLAVEIPDIEQMIRSAFPPQSPPSSVAALAHRVDGASRLASAGFLDPALAANLAIRGIASVSAHDLDPSLSAPVITEELLPLVERYVSVADTDALITAAAALKAAGWLSIPAHDYMRVLVSSRLPDDHRDRDINAKHLVALRTEIGEAAYPTIAAWLRGISPGPTEMLSVMAPWMVSGMPPVIGDALRDYAAAADQEKLNNTALRVTRTALVRRPSRQFLTIIRYSAADEQCSSEAIVALAQKASNQQTRTTVLDLWAALGPRDTAVRKRLITEVLIPMSTHGQGAYDLVRTRLVLAKDPPRGVKATMVDALLAAAPDAKRKHKMEDKMADVGLRPRRKRLGIF